jgi:hypothetical protein
VCRATSAFCEPTARQARGISRLWRRLVDFGGEQLVGFDGWLKHILRLVLVKEVRRVREHIKKDKNEKK